MKLTLSHKSSSVIHDPEFIRWVINPSEELDCYWNQYLLENPDKCEETNEARFLIHSFISDEESLSETEKSGLWLKIIHLISRRQRKIIFLKRFISVTSFSFIFPLKSAENESVSFTVASMN